MKNLTIILPLFLLISSCSLIPSKEKRSKLAHKTSLENKLDQSIDEYAKRSDKALDLLLNTKEQDYYDVNKLVKIQESYHTIVKYSELSNIKECLDKINYYNSLSTCLQKRNEKIMHQMKMKIKNKINSPQRRMMEQIKEDPKI